MKVSLHQGDQRLTALLPSNYPRLSISNRLGQPAYSDLRHCLAVWFDRRAELEAYCSLLEDSSPTTRGERSGSLR
jgi:hypothetical protein